MKRVVALSLIFLIVTATLASCSKPGTDDPPAINPTDSLTTEVPASITDQPTTNPADSTEADTPTSIANQSATDPTSRPTAEKTRPDTKQLKFGAQYTQTFGYHPDRQYPIITVISTKDELERYHEKYKDQYNFASNTSPAPDGIEPWVTIEFTDAIKKYTDGFFKDNYLVIVLMEDSLEKQYRVDSVAESGDIVIRRFNPKLSLLTITAWSIIIEVNSNIKPAQFKVDMVNEAIS